MHRVSPFQLQFYNIGDIKCTTNNVYGWWLTCYSGFQYRNHLVSCSCTYILLISIMVYVTASFFFKKSLTPILILHKCNNISKFKCALRRFEVLCCRYAPEIVSNVSMGDSEGELVVLSKKILLRIFVYVPCQKHHLPSGHVTRKIRVLPICRTHGVKYAGKMFVLRPQLLWIKREQNVFCNVPTYFHNSLITSYVLYTVQILTCKFKTHEINWIV